MTQKRNGSPPRAKRPQKPKTALKKAVTDFPIAAMSEEHKAELRAMGHRMLGLGPRQPPRFAPDPDNPKSVNLAPEDLPYLYQMAEATGTLHYDASFSIAVHLLNVVAPGSSDPSGRLRSAFAHLLDIAPRDGLEGMLAAQMVAVHTAAMGELADSRHDAFPEIRTARVNRASRLMRLFALQMDTLNKNRGKGPSEQKVTVEHVHVNEGGQAVVGVVSPPPKQLEPGGEEG